MNPYSPDGFWNKAVLFINRATEPTENRTDDEARLWASLAFEQIAKWTLADISPALVADPVNDGGSQLLSALELKDNSKPVTAAAKTVFKRCSEIVKPFSYQAAMRIAAARNEYLHGTGIEIVALPDDVWWPKFWSLVKILLTSRQHALDDLVDPHRVSQIEEELNKNERQIAEEYETLTGAAETRLRRLSSGTLTTAEVAELDRRARHIHFSTYTADAHCPVCESIGQVGADDYTSRDLVWDENGVAVEVTFYPDYFFCDNCYLVLERYELIELSELDSEFTAFDEVSDYGFAEYGND